MLLFAEAELRVINITRVIRNKSTVFSWEFPKGWKPRAIEIHFIYWGFNNTSKRYNPTKIYERRLEIS